MVAINPVNPIWQNQVSAIQGWTYYPNGDPRTPYNFDAPPQPPVWINSQSGQVSYTDPVTPNWGNNLGDTTNPIDVTGGGQNVVTPPVLQPPVVTPPVNPPSGGGDPFGNPLNGDIRTGADGVRYRWDAGIMQWVVVPPLTSVGVSPATNQIENDYGPVASFLEYLGLGGRTASSRNPAESFKANMYAPFKELYGLQQRFAEPGAPTSSQFTPYSTLVDYLQGIGGVNRQNQFNQGQNFLQTLLDTSPANRNLLGMDYTPTQNIGTSGDVQMGTANIGELQNLMELGLRNKYGIQGAKYTAARLPEEQEAFYGQQATGAQPTGANFLDYLRNKWKF
jgi:hypothetical protein